MRDQFLLPQEHQHRKGAVLAVLLQLWLPVKWQHPRPRQPVLDRDELRQWLQLLAEDQHRAQDQARELERVVHAQRERE